MSEGMAIFGKYHRPQYSPTQFGMDTSVLLGLVWFGTKVISYLLKVFSTQICLDASPRPPDTLPFLSVISGLELSGDACSHQTF